MIIAANMFLLPGLLIIHSLSLLLLFRGRREPGQPRCAKSRLGRREGADAARDGTGLRHAAGAATCERTFDAAPQLTRRNCSGAQDGQKNGCEQRGFENLSGHDQCSFGLKTWVISAGSASGLIPAHPLLKLGQRGIVQHSGPDLLHFSGMIDKDGLRSELKTVVHCSAGIHL